MMILTVLAAGGISVAIITLFVGMLVGVAVAALELGALFVAIVSAVPAIRLKAKPNMV